MRLINAKSLRLEDFFNRPAPAYAILSHTWGEYEVTYDDYDRRIFAALDDDAGSEKIKRCCSRAAADQHQYVWIDSCCIDKKSSAELAEAINSMYRWYTGAAVCYVILTDVVPSTSWEHATDSLRKSRWFTRGWTLQELLAPSHLVFLNQEWKMMFEYYRKGSEVHRVELSMEMGGLSDDGVMNLPLHARMVTLNWRKQELPKILSSITGIDVDFIFGSRDPVGAIISEKMSWAAERQTTRQEDAAYCLLGLFDISMPLLYGEGTKALRRLQAAIAAESDDHTLFAWGYGSEIGQFLHGQDQSMMPQSIFANTTRAFANGSLLERLSAEAVPWYPDIHYSVTNKGINMSLPFLDLPGLNGVASLAAFKCTNRNNGAWNKSRNIIAMVLYHSRTDSAQMYRLTSDGAPILVPTRLFENANSRVSYLQLTLSSSLEARTYQVSGLLLALEMVQEAHEPPEEHESGPIRLRRYSDDPNFVPPYDGWSQSRKVFRQLLDDENNASLREPDFLGAVRSRWLRTANNPMETLALVLVEAYPPHRMVETTNNTITVTLTNEFATAPTTPLGLSYFGLRLSHGIPDPTGAGTILIMVQYLPATSRAIQAQHQIHSMRLTAGTGYSSLISYILQPPDDAFNTNMQDTVDLSGLDPGLYGHLRCTPSIDNLGHCVLSFKWLHIILSIIEYQPLEQLDLDLPTPESSSRLSAENTSVAAGRQRLDWKDF